MKRPLIPLAACLFLAGCVTALGPRTDVSVDYYNVKGTSFAELDREFALHGPVVSGVGKAIASTRVRMIPDVRFSSRSGRCQIAIARIRVKANITLPRLTDRKRVKGEMSEAFSSIEEYARLHEAVHVRIAEEHAALAETSIRSLKPRDNCKQLSADVTSTFMQVMKRHETAQQAFDQQERKRFQGSQVIKRET